MSDGMEVVLQCKFCPHFVPFGNVLAGIQNRQDAEDAVQLTKDLFHNHIATRHPEYLYKLEEE
jgi:hypothetical protein